MEQRTLKKSFSFPLGFLEPERLQFSEGHEQSSKKTTAAPPSPTSVRKTALNEKNHVLKNDDSPHIAILMPEYGSLEHHDGDVTSLAASPNDSTVPLLRSTRNQQNPFDEMAGGKKYRSEVLLLYVKFLPTAIILCALLQNWVFNNPETARVLGFVGLVSFFIGMHIFSICLSALDFEPQDFLAFRLWFYFWPIAPFSVGRYWQLFYDSQGHEDGIALMILSILFALTNAAARFTSKGVKRAATLVNDGRGLSSPLQSAPLEFLGYA